MKIFSCFFFLYVTGAPEENFGISLKNKIIGLNIVEDDIIENMENDINGVVTPGANSDNNSNDNDFGEDYESDSDYNVIGNTMR